MHKDYAPFLLRLTLGILFIIPGVLKLINPGTIIGLLNDLGIPAATFFGWVLLLSEIIFGIAVLIGWHVDKTIWPLVLILAVATIIVHIPTLATGPMALITILFHLLGIAALVSLYFSGPGILAVKK